MSHFRNNEKEHLKSLEETERNKTNQIFGLHTADGGIQKRNGKYRPASTKPGSDRTRSRIGL